MPAFAAHAVREVLRVAEEPGIGGDVENPTARACGGRPVRERSAARVQRSGQMDTKRRVPVIGLDVEDRTGADDPGRVDEDVDLPELGERRGDHPLGLLRMADVRHQPLADATLGANLRRSLLRDADVSPSAVEGRAEIGDHHPRALASERTGDLATDSSPATGDDGDLAFEPATAPRPGPGGITGSVGSTFRFLAHRTHRSRVARGDCRRPSIARRGSAPERSGRTGLPIGCRRDSDAGRVSRESIFRAMIRPPCRKQGGRS